MFVWPCVYYSVYWLSVVFYRAKVEPAIDVAFKQSDSTPIGDDAADTASSPSSSIRTRKLFPETWLWENVYVTGYPFFQSYLRNRNKLPIRFPDTHTYTTLPGFSNLINSTFGWWILLTKNNLRLFQLQLDLDIYSSFYCNFPN